MLKSKEDGISVTENETSKSVFNKITDSDEEEFVDVDKENLKRKSAASSQEGKGKCFRHKFRMFHCKM